MPDGASGNGYSLTPFGRGWLPESDRDDFCPNGARSLCRHVQTLPIAFRLRVYECAQEAIPCYGAHAYLACGAICGAAAESILLAVAVAKKGDEEEVLRAYNAARGRSRAESDIGLGQPREELKREFRRYTVLLKYWRDEAAHGKASGISDNEAFTSLAYLLRFVQFADAHWNELTGPTS